MATKFMEESFVILGTFPEVTIDDNIAQAAVANLMCH